MNILNIELKTTDSVITRQLKFQAEKWVNLVNDVNVMKERKAFMIKFIKFLEECDETIETNEEINNDIRYWLTQTKIISEKLINKVPIIPFNLDNMDENNIHILTERIYREQCGKDEWNYYDKEAYVMCVSNYFDYVDKRVNYRPHEEIQNKVYLINHENILTGKYIKHIKFKEVFEKLILLKKYYLCVDELQLAHTIDSSIFITSVDIINEMTMYFEDLYEIVYGEDEDIENLHINLTEFEHK